MSGRMLEGVSRDVYKVDRPIIGVSDSWTLVLPKARTVLERDGSSERGDRVFFVINKGTFPVMLALVDESTADGVKEPTRTSVTEINVLSPSRTGSGSRLRVAGDSFLGELWGRTLGGRSCNIEVFEGWFQ